MPRFVIETTAPFFKRINGYQCNAQSIHHMLCHIHIKFQYKKRGSSVIHYFYSESELYDAHRHGKIRVIMIGDETHDE
jgi:hypothetical protein